MQQSQTEYETVREEGVVGRLKEALTAKTDTQLSAMLGVPRATIASWKRRGRVPQEVLLNAASKAGVSLDWLVTGKGEPHQKGFVLPSIDAELLAIAIHRAQQWWTDFDKGKRPVTPPQLAELIAWFYDRSTDQYWTFKRHTSAGREEILEALRRFHGLTARPEMVGPRSAEVDVQGMLDAEVRDAMAALDRAERLTPEERQAISALVRRLSSTGH